MRLTGEPRSRLWCSSDLLVGKLVRSERDLILPQAITDPAESPTKNRFCNQCGASAIEGGLGLKSL